MLPVADTQGPLRVLTEVRGAVNVAVTDWFGFTQARAASEPARHCTRGGPMQHARL